LTIEYAREIIENEIERETMTRMTKRQELVRKAANHKNTDGSTSSMIEK
jgi:hypothetical protein